MEYEKKKLAREVDVHDQEYKNLLSDRDITINSLQKKLSQQRQARIREQETSEQLRKATSQKVVASTKKVEDLQQELGGLQDALSDLQTSLAHTEKISENRSKTLRAVQKTLYRLRTKVATIVDPDPLANAADLGDDKNDDRVLISFDDWIAINRQYCVATTVSSSHEYVAAVRRLVFTFLNGNVASNQGPQLLKDLFELLGISLSSTPSRATFQRMQRELGRICEAVVGQDIHKHVEEHTIFGLGQDGTTDKLQQFVAIDVHLSTGVVPLAVSPTVSHSSADMLETIQETFTRIHQATERILSLESANISLAGVGATISDHANGAVRLNLDIMKQNENFCRTLTDNWDELSPKQQDEILLSKVVYGCGMHANALLGTYAREALIKIEKQTFSSLSKLDQQRIQALAAVVSGEDCWAGKLLMALDKTVSPNPSRERGRGLNYAAWATENERLPLDWQALRGERYNAKFRNAFFSYEARVDLIGWFEQQQECRDLNQTERAVFGALQVPIISAEWVTMALLYAEILRPFMIAVKSAQSAADLLPVHQNLLRGLQSAKAEPELLLDAYGSSVLPKTMIDWVSEQAQTDPKRRAEARKFEAVYMDQHAPADELETMIIDCLSNMITKFKVLKRNELTNTADSTFVASHNDANESKFGLLKYYRSVAPAAHPDTKNAKILASKTNIQQRLFGLSDGALHAAVGFSREVSEAIGTKRQISERSYQKIVAREQEAAVKRKEAAERKNQRFGKLRATPRCSNIADAKRLSDAAVKSQLQIRKHIDQVKLGPILSLPGPAGRATRLMALIDLIKEDT